MILEKLRMRNIGKGGVADDVALEDEVDKALVNLAALVLDEKATGNGVVTIKLVVQKTGEQNVTITHSVAIKQPGMLRKSTAAFVTKQGELMTAQHKQEAIVFSDPSVEVVNVDN